MLVSVPLVFYVFLALLSLFRTPASLIAASCCRNCLIWTVSLNSKMRFNKHVLHPPLHAFPNAHTSSATAVDDYVE